MTQFDAVKESMKVLIEDNTTPKTVREKLSNMIDYLNNGEDLQKKISTVLSEIEEMSADINIPPYVRTQLFSVSSELEAIGSED